MKVRRSEAIGSSTEPTVPERGEETSIAAGLTGRTPRTITNPDTLRRELAAIPDRGWAFEREEGNVGVSCVGAPIFGPLGVV